MVRYWVRNNLCMCTVYRLSLCTVCKCVALPTMVIHSTHTHTHNVLVNILDISLVDQKSYRMSGLFQRNSTLMEHTGKPLSLPLNRAQDSIRRSRVTPPTARRSISRDDKRGTGDNNYPTYCNRLHNYYSMTIITFIQQKGKLVFS